MAGAIKKFFKSFNDDDDDYYDDDEFFDEDEEYEEEPRNNFFRKKSSASYDDYDEDEEYEDRPAPRRNSGKSSSKITNINNRRASGYDAMDVRIIKPSNFDLDTHEIADNLLAQRTVILNLEGIDVGLAQRIIDFSFGSCYALNGNFRAITKSILLITPSNVNITGVLDKVNESLSISDD